MLSRIKCFENEHIDQAQINLQVNEVFDIRPKMMNLGATTPTVAVSERFDALQQQQHASLTSNNSAATTTIAANAAAIDGQVRTMLALQQLFGQQQQQQQQQLSSPIEQTSQLGKLLTTIPNYAAAAASLMSCGIDFEQLLMQLTMCRTDPTMVPILIASKGLPDAANSGYAQSQEMVLDKFLEENLSAPVYAIARILLSNCRRTMIRELEHLRNENTLLRCAFYNNQANTKILQETECNSNSNNATTTVVTATKNRKSC